MMRKLACLLCLSSLALHARDRDLSKRIEPRELEHHYETAHSDLKLPDLRKKIGSWNGVRLFCHNGRGPSFAFTFTRRDDASYTFEWQRLERADGKSWQRTASGEGDANPDTATTIDEVLTSDAFRKSPTATLPVAVGWPYLYFVESVSDGEYKALYRDHPRSDWKARKLVAFNRLVRAMVRATGVDGEKIVLPDEPLTLPDKGGSGTQR